MLLRYHAAMVVLGVQGSLLLHTSALAHSPSVQNIARVKGCGRKGSVPQQQDMLRRRFRRGPGRGGLLISESSAANQNPQMRLKSQTFKPRFPRHMAGMATMSQKTLVVRDGN
jgi:hypothetical protein